MEIRNINNDPSYARISARWVFEEFILSQRPGITFEKILWLFENRNDEDIPMSFVAVKNGVCAGTVSLVANDLHGSNYTPWAAALYVVPHLRNKHIGRKMLEKAQMHAKLMGYSKLYLRTETAFNYYLDLGWEYIEEARDEFGLKATVMSKQI